MKIKLISTSADYGKLKEEYIKAFNAKESKTEDDYGDQIYTYEVAVSSVEKLFEIAKKINQELIISSKDGFRPNRIEIYDGYREWIWKSRLPLKVIMLETDSQNQIKCIKLGTDWGKKWQKRSLCNFVKNIF